MPAGAVPAPRPGTLPCPAEPIRTSATVRHTLVVGGVERTYLLARPWSGTTPGRQAPLLLAFHGYSTSGAALARHSGLASAAGASGFVTVFPDGTGTPSRWALPGRLEGPDDVAFVVALIRDVTRRTCIDPTRIYAAGFSNGAAFAGLLACRHPGLLAGIALVGGANLAPPCAAARAPRRVTVVLVHGDRDLVVPLAGGPVLGGALRAEPFAVTEARWRAARDRAVSSTTLAGGGHTWPRVATAEIVAIFGG